MLHNNSAAGIQQPASNFNGYLSVGCSRSASGLTDTDRDQIHSCFIELWLDFEQGFRLHSTQSTQQPFFFIKVTPYSPQAYGQGKTFNFSQKLQSSAKIF